MTNRTRGLPHYLGLGVSAGLMALVLALALAVVVVPKLTGSTPLTVLTGSMEPTYPPGTLIVVRPTPAEDIRIGDVVTFQLRSEDPTLVTHRVVGVGTSTDGSITFTTQGDDNDAADEPILAEQVQGVVWYGVPLFGWVNTAVNGPARAYIVPILAVLLLGYAAVNLGSGVRDALRRRGADSARSSTTPIAGS